MVTAGMAATAVAVITAATATAAARSGVTEGSGEAASGALVEGWPCCFVAAEAGASSPSRSIASSTQVPLLELGVGRVVFLAFAVTGARLADSGPMCTWFMGACLTSLGMVLTGPSPSKAMCRAGRRSVMCLSSSCPVLLAT